MTLFKIFNQELVSDYTIDIRGDLATYNLHPHGAIVLKVLAQSKAITGTVRLLRNLLNIYLITIFENSGKRIFHKILY